MQPQEDKTERHRDQPSNNTLQEWLKSFPESLRAKLSQLISAIKQQEACSENNATPGIEELTKRTDDLRTLKLAQSDPARFIALEGIYDAISEEKLFSRIAKVKEFKDSKAFDGLEFVPAHLKALLLSEQGLGGDNEPLLANIAKTLCGVRDEELLRATLNTLKEHFLDKEAGKAPLEGSFHWLLHSDIAADVEDLVINRVCSDKAPLWLMNQVSIFLNGFVSEDLHEKLEASLFYLYPLQTAEETDAIRSNLIIALTLSDGPIELKPYTLFLDDLTDSRCKDTAYALMLKYLSQEAQKCLDLNEVVTDFKEDLNSDTLDESSLLKFDLLSVLSDPDTQRWLYRHYTKLSKRANANTAHGLIRMQNSLAQSHNPFYEEGLVGKLDDAAIDEGLIDILKHTPNEKIIDRVIEGLSEGDKVYKLRAINILSTRPEKRCTDLLCSLSSDFAQDSDVQLAAIKALSGHSDKFVPTTLFLLFSTAEDAEVVNQAAITLGTLSSRSEEMDLSLWEHYKRDEPFEMLSYPGAKALYQSKNETVQSSLLNAYWPHGGF